MSMVAGKMDAVSVNRVWEEHVKKEQHTLRLNETFQIPNPRKMDILAEKPNYIVPQPNPTQASIDDANQTLTNLSSQKDSERVPPEKFALPVTGNMEYGFFAKAAARTKPNPMFQYPLHTCDVTDYAQEYSKSNGGVGPYTTRLQ